MAPEVPHQPARHRERAMKGFRWMGAAQRFLSSFSKLSPHLRPRRPLVTAALHRTKMVVRSAIRDQITNTTDVPPTG
ncbi:hypothetical protein ACFQ9J_13845 [Streptomyces sp. NPDC056529]|uniref:hypothetical protein n=1 Tax=Streptomyces sp. NPDC056529 TaxID=3345855 RepID=UPI0036BA2E9B